MNTKSSIFTSGKATSENKNRSYTEKVKFSVSLCFKIAIIKFILMRQQSRQRNSFFSGHFTSNLMLSACLLGMILIVNVVCNSKIA